MGPIECQKISGIKLVNGKSISTITTAISTIPTAITDKTVSNAASSVLGYAEYISGILMIFTLV